MSTTSSMLNEEFGYIKYDEELLKKLKLYTEHDGESTTCNNKNNIILYNNNVSDDFNSNDKNCAVQQIKTDVDNNINIKIPTIPTQSLIQVKTNNEITTRHSSQQITCTSIITKPRTSLTSVEITTIHEQNESLNNCLNDTNTLSDCDKSIKQSKKRNICDTNSTDPLLIRRRQSYLVLSIDYQQKKQDLQDNNNTPEIEYENYSGKRRPTLTLGDIQIIPNDNPALNDRRLSQLQSIQFHDKKRLSFIRRMSALVTDSKDGGVVNIHDLPMTFQVKYLGHCPAKGLWGIKHTRGPVDTMVKVAKNLPPGQILPIVRVTISTKGITIIQQVNSRRIENSYPIETISYGVQDLVYTRVFSMIVVYEDMKDQHPFECHAFVCESRNSARQLTYALAAAFQDYSKRVQENAKDDPSSPVKKKFAIDLRTPEEIQEDIEAETEA